MWNCRITSSCLLVVTLGCPGRGLSAVDPALRSLPLKLTIVCIEQFNLLATSVNDTLGCSMPIARSLSEVVKCGISTTASTVTDKNLLAFSSLQDFKIAIHTKSRDFLPSGSAVGRKRLFYASCMCKAEVSPLSKKSSVV